MVHFGYIFMLIFVVFQHCGHALFSYSYTLLHNMMFKY